MDITQGRGATVIYDAVGHDTFNNSFDCLGRFGHLVSYGQASGDIGPVNISRFAAKSARLSRPNFSHYTDSREKVTEISGKLFAAIREGMVRPVIGQEFPLAESAAAHRALESRATVGSTILLP
jgi:NADPH2:quinone reductase